MAWRHLSHAVEALLSHADDELGEGVVVDYELRDGYGDQAGGPRIVHKGEGSSRCLTHESVVVRRLRRSFRRCQQACEGDGSRILTHHIRTNAHELAQRFLGLESVSGTSDDLEIIKNVIQRQLYEDVQDRIAAWRRRMEEDGKAVFVSVKKRAPSTVPTTSIGTSSEDLRRHSQCFQSAMEETAASKLQCYR